MKAILFFISFLFFISCESNESAIGSIGETAKEVIDKAKATGGAEGLSSLNKKIDELEDKLSDKKKAYKRLQYEIEDNEDDLKETNDELEDIATQLSQRLTPEKRKELEDRKAFLERKKTQLEGTISSLNTQKATLESDLATARSDLQAMTNARDNLQTQLDDRTTERNTARTERDCWKKTKDDFCARNQKLKTVVIAQVAGISACEDINYCHLEDITRLDLSGSFDRQSACNSNPEYNRLTTLQPSDFIGFTKLEFLNLSGNCLKELEQSPPLFKHLTKIKEINLQDTNIIRLSKNFFTSDNIDTLEDGKVWVNWFLYCTGTGTPYKDKLSSEAKAYHTREDPNNPESYYCYE